MCLQRLSWPQGPHPRNKTMHVRDSIGECLLTVQTTTVTSLYVTLKSFFYTNGIHTIRDKLIVRLYTLNGKSGSFPFRPYQHSDEDRHSLRRSGALFVLSCSLCIVKEEDQNNRLCRNDLRPPPTCFYFGIIGTVKVQVPNKAPASIDFQKIVSLL